MRLFTLIKNIFINKRPIYVIYFVTSKCNANCKMCFNWKNIQDASDEEELNLEEIKKIFDNFSTIQQLTISGGEPFLRSDLPEILEYISHENNVQQITIPTNGILTGKTVEMVKEVLTNIKNKTHLRVGLSLTGIGKQHDDIVQVNGAFEKLMETYKVLNALLSSNENLSIDIGICISKYNKDGMQEILDFAFDTFKDSNILLLLTRGDTRDKEAVDVKLDEYQAILDYYKEKLPGPVKNKPFSALLDKVSHEVYDQVGKVMISKTMPSKCYAGSKLIVIQANGDVFPCECLNKKLGNLRDQDYDIEQIMKKSKRIKKFIKDGRCYCTWECALANNIVCNPRNYWKIFRKNLNASTH